MNAECAGPEEPARQPATSPLPGGFDQQTSGRKQRKRRSLPRVTIADHESIKLLVARADEVIANVRKTTPPERAKRGRPL